MEASPESLSPLHRRLRDARRAGGLTQAELARRVGCQQSAISMYEAGRAEALARPTVRKLAELLGVEPGDDTAVTPSGGGGRASCPSGRCPSNIPFAVGDELLFWPRAQPAGGGRNCAYCGELLERSCRRCGAPLGEGACCAACGAAKVEPPAEAAGADPEAWAEARRRVMAGWLGLV